MESSTPQVTTLAYFVKVVHERYKFCNTVLQFDKDPDRSFRMRMIMRQN